MEAINESIKLIAQSIEILKKFDHQEESEVLQLLKQALDKLSSSSM